MNKKRSKYKGDKDEVRETNECSIYMSVKGYIPEP